MSRYYTVAEVVKILGLHENTVWRKIHNGEIPAFRLGVAGKWLIPKEWIDNLASKKQEVRKA